MEINIFETEKKYKIIYANPPWKYNTYSAKGQNKKSAKSHFHCMEKEDIVKIPVSKICADDCILFLWVTFPCLKDGLELIEKWGFEYKTCAFNWVKKNKHKDSLFTGLGFWTRSNSEICLLATRGRPKRIDKSVHQVIYSKIREYGQKPDEAREKIVKLCGDIPMIELFAKEQVNGWDYWRNEV